MLLCTGADDDLEALDEDEDKAMANALLGLSGKGRRNRGTRSGRLAEVEVAAAGGVQSPGGGGGGGSPAPLAPASPPLPRPPPPRTMLDTIADIRSGRMDRAACEAMAEGAAPARLAALNGRRPTAAELAGTLHGLMPYAEDLPPVAAGGRRDSGSSSGQHAAAAEPPLAVSRPRATERCPYCGSRAKRTAQNRCPSCFAQLEPLD